MPVTRVQVERSICARLGIACLLAVAPACASDPAGVVTDAGETGPRPSSRSAITRDCSGSRVTLGFGEQDLPEAVARTRERLVVAALTCDFEQLGALAAEGAEGFRYSFSGNQTAPQQFWRQLELTGQDAPLEALVTVLSMPPGVVDSPDMGGPIYVWPAAATKPTPAASDWGALAEASGPDEVLPMQRGGGYFGWRVAINERGEWVYFVFG